MNNVLSLRAILLLLFLCFNNLPVSAKLVIYLTKNNPNQVDIFDATTHQLESKLVDLPDVPSGIAISLDGKFSYVTSANTISGSTGVVYIINNTKKIIERSIDVGMNPFGIVLTPDGKYAYVANSGSHSVSVIKIADGSTIKRILITPETTSQPKHIAITPDGHEVYVIARTSGTTDSVTTVIRTETNEVVTEVLTAQPNGIAMSPKGDFAYVSANYSRDVVVIKTDAGHSASYIDMRENLLSLTTSVDGRYVYVSDYRNARILVIDTANNNTILSNSVSIINENPRGALAIPDGKSIYFLCPTNIQVFDPLTLTVLPGVAGASYVAAAVMPDTPQVHITSKHTNGLVSTDFYNVITWSAPVSPFPLHYEVYRDKDMTELLGTVESGAPNSIEEHRLQRNSHPTYYVVAKNPYGIIAIGSATA